MLNKVLKIVGIVFGSLVLLGIMAYGAMSYYFRYRFPYGTYINNVNAAKAENGVMYNLAGQKVNNGYKGVVIMNGKKMLNK